MVERFLEYIRFELNRANLTVEAYKRDITQFQHWLLPENPEKVDFKEVTTADIRSWLTNLSKRGESPRTLRRKIISLRSLFKWMIKTRQIKVSPLRNVPLPKISRPLPDLIKSEEIENALKNTEISETSDKEKNQNQETESLLNNLIIDMLYSLGIRRAELVGLNDSDVSFYKGEIKVTGKRSKQRVIPAPQRLLDKIKKWQNIRDQTVEKPENESPLFVKKGKRITASQVYSIVHKGLSESTARKKSPHALRHSFASVMLNGGAEIDSVREFLGHSTLSTTQIYTHVSLHAIKQAYTSAHPRAHK